MTGWKVVLHATISFSLKLFVYMQLTLYMGGFYMTSGAPCVGCTWLACKTHVYNIAQGCRSSPSFDKWKKNHVDYLCLNCIHNDNWCLHDFHTTIWQLQESYRICKHWNIYVFSKFKIKYLNCISETLIMLFMSLLYTCNELWIPLRDPVLAWGSRFWQLRI